MKAIPRGIVYHRLRSDIFYFFKGLFCRLDDQKKVKDFEDSFAQYMRMPHCTAFPFARTALYFALKSQNFKPGSEIILPPITIKPMLEVSLACGLKPIFVDINLETLCFDAEKLKNAINPNTKAVLITYLLGMVPNINEMVSLCKQNNIFIIEDFSQCLNGKYEGKKMGTFGDVGIYSSSSIKTLDTYGGGITVCKNADLDAKLKQFQKELSVPSRSALLKKIWTDFVRNFATTRSVFHFLTFPALKIATRFSPEKSIKHVGSRDMALISKLPGLWFEKYTSLQAEFGLRLITEVEKGDKVRQTNVHKVKNISEKAGLKFPRGSELGENVYWQFVSYFTRPFDAQKFFQKKKIDTSTTSLLQISNLPGSPYQGNTPNASHFHSRGLFIPAYPGLKNYEVEHIAKSLVESAQERLV